MGLFDTVRCDYPLPDHRHQDLSFQTKSLESLLEDYTITQEGRLIRHAWRGGDRPARDIEWPIHGDLRIYTSETWGEKVWVEYIVRFTHGRVEWLKTEDEVRASSAIPPPWLGWGVPLMAFHDASETEPQTAQAAATDNSGTPGSDARDAEKALLLALHRDRAELESLLRANSDHWGFEDPVYRFYHQSFKVFGLQRSTQAIVDRLQALAPDRPLNPWFLEIMKSGTNREFKIEDNARWLEATRPILEAFFHARFFLEVAARYSYLDKPRQLLPSGYAALLYLFGLR